MNKQQFNLIADKTIRKEPIRKGVYDVIFKGLTCYEAERKYHCVPNTVKRAVDSVNKHYDHCVAVVSAK